MGSLHRWLSLWRIGVVATFAIGLSIVAFGVVAALTISGLGEVAEMFGARSLGDDGLRDALLLTAPLWLPLAVGAMLPTLSWVIGDDLARIRAARAQAEIAPYMKGASPRG